MRRGSRYRWFFLCGILLLCGGIVYQSRGGQSTTIESSQDVSSKDAESSVQEISIAKDAGIVSQGTWEQSKEGERFYKATGTFYHTFDTIIQLTIYAKDEAEFEQLFNGAKAEFERYNNLYDAYHAVEGVVNVHTLNQKAGKEAVQVPEELFDLLKFSKEQAEATLSKTNVAMGTVTALWREAMQKKKVPEQADVEQAIAHTNLEQLQLDEANHTVRFLDPELQVDVGSVAKGDATERVAQWFIEKGVRCALINAGGNVKTIGTPVDDRSAWRVGITDPKAPAEIYCVIPTAPGMSVVTSGDYQRYFEVGQKRYHHLIDPDTGYPGGADRSVSIVTEDARWADYLSTCFFLSDAEQRQQIRDHLEKQHPELHFEVMTIDQKDQWQATDGLKEQIEREP